MYTFHFLHFVLMCTLIKYCYFTTEKNTLRNKKVTESSPTLFVGNLSYTTTRSSLMEAFDGCVDALVAVDPHTGKTMG